MIYFAIATGCLFVIALSVFIYRTLSVAKDKKIAQQQIVQQHIDEHRERQEYVSSSINIIVKALATKQIEVVEASIRLKVLVDQLRPNLPENSFPVMEQLFLKTQHIPKLKAWKALDKKQRKQFTKEMNLLETEASQAVRAEVIMLGEMMEQRG